jgi:hypothetical protein
MPDHRHRDGKLKVMHTIIGDFGKILRQMAQLDEVDSILTGTISPSKSYRESLTFQYFTDNGLKLLAKTTTAVQEIFVVAKEPEVLLGELIKMGLVDTERPDVKHTDMHRRRRRGGPRRSDPALVDHTRNRVRRTGDPKRTSAPAPQQIGKPVQDTSAKDAVTLDQRLTPESLERLRSLRDRIAAKQTQTQTQAPVRMKTAPEGPAGTPDGKRRTASKSARTADAADDPEDFAAMLDPQDDEESFAELFNKSKLDPKFFK